MNRQYNPQRFRYHNGRCIGTIELGTIVYLQDCRDLRDARCINPWIVTAWHNREYCGAELSYMVGGHLATVKSLRDGRELRVADHILRSHIDAGLAVES